MSKVKIVIQQCLSAKLKLPNDGETLSIGRGMVVFVCFLSGSDQDSAVKAAEVACKVKLSESDSSSKRLSIIDFPGDVLIIPQATLGGKLKGKAVQYHSNVDKDIGMNLYRTFCDNVARLVGVEHVRLGIYGARQVLSTETNGPFTHVFEL